MNVIDHLLFDLLTEMFLNNFRLHQDTDVRLHQRGTIKKGCFCEEIFFNFIKKTTQLIDEWQSYLASQ